MIIAIVLTAIAFGLGTWGFRWVAVPVIGKRPVWTAAGAAAGVGRAPRTLGAADPSSSDR